MATVNKDFKIKSGLIVEGTTATVNGYDILTKKQGDQDYIVSLIGGSAESGNVADTVVLRDETGSFATQDITLDGTLYAGNIVESSGVTIAADNGDIVLNADGWVYAGTANSQNIVATRGRVDDLIGDPTVDSSTGNTIADRINDAQSSAVSEANSATDIKLQDYTKTSDLDTAIDGYGYLKSADLTGYATETYADNAAGTAETNANTYTDNKISDSSTATDKVWSAYKTSTEIGLAQAAAELHADNAVAALIDQAPAMLDTLNELAASLGDNADFIGTVNAAIGEKVAKAGDTMTGELVLSADPTQALAAATKQYVDAQASDAYNDAIAQADQTAQGYANTAEQNAKDYADALDTDDVAEGIANLYFTNQRAIDAVGGTIGDAINELTTDDIEEGLANQYFTDSRAKTSAADLLTGATLSNITITGNGSGLTITAENGVAGSTTDDLTEGDNNLYFQNSRVYDAIEGSNIQPQSVDITWVRREEATWTGVPTASKATCHSAGTGEGSMKYLVRVTASVGGTRHSHVTEVLATVDGTNGVAVVEYGTIYTSAEPLATVTVEWNASTSQYDLNVTTANNSSEVMVAATLMAALD